ncbi:MAG: TAXI family TRAP transporter solute-binding subunit, partial [Deltaproteobacteria bacterium]
MRKLIVVSCLLIGLLAAGLLSSDSALAATRNILIAGGRTADTWYAFSQALAKFINEKSDWLRAEVVSTAGITGNVDMAKEKPKQYIAISSFTHIHYRPGHAWGEKRGFYTGGRFIANATSMTQCVITYDKNIKTVQDLAGKTVDVGRKGSANAPDHKAILEKYGVLDKVKLVYTGYGGGANKLTDGLVDATFLLFNHIYPTTFSKGGFIEKLETRGPVYYVGFDRDTLLQLREEECATVPVRIPAGALDPKTQSNGLWAFNDPTFFMADQSMDEDVVYEITRIIWETPAEEWAKWHPIGAHMNEKFKPALPSLKLYKAHPGAKKFYDEHGIELKDLADLLR